MFYHRTSIRLSPLCNIFLMVFFLVAVPFIVFAQQEQSIAENIPLKIEDDAENTNSDDVLSIFDQQTLFGSVLGIRNLSTPLGIEFGGTIKNEIWQNLSGGRYQKGTDIFYVDFIMAADLYEAVGWNGASMFVHFLGNNGNSISNGIGDYQIVSNIESYPMRKLFQCWIQQTFGDNELSLLVGLYDLNSEFYVTQSSGLFLNSSHGIGFDLAQTGNNGPSIFPNAALAFRVSYSPSDNIYAHCALFDGMPGDPVDPNKFGISLSAADGYFAVAEIGTEQENVSKIGIGVWKYSGSFSDLCSTIDPSIDIQRTDNYGAYVLFDQLLYGGDESAAEAMHGFARFGIANGHVNCFDYQFGAGIVYKGLFQSRSDDEIGFAVAAAHASEDYRSYILLSYSRNAATETSHEVTYRMKFAEWFFVQYDVQYIVHPSANPTVTNAVAAGIRCEVVL